MNVKARLLAIKLAEKQNDSDVFEQLGIQVTLSKREIQSQINEANENV